jgi:ubiquinone biosynthesis UbiH/UbiF/VisC/COQ6 family hydroxylase
MSSTASTAGSPQSRVDVAVVGSGVVGLAAALGCAQQGFAVALIGPPARLRALRDDAPFDARVYAIAPGATALLARLGVWNKIDAARICRIERMRIFGDAGAALAFDAYSAAVERLATIVEESELLRVLAAACDYQPAIRRESAPMSALHVGADAARVELDDGRAIEARVVVGADGAQSAVRAAIGANADVHDYRQQGVVANFACERPHQDTAFQWFTDEGVLALLPLPRQHVSMVWSAPDALAAQLLQLAPEALAARVGRRSAHALGALAPAGAAHAFALRRIRVDKLVAPRVVLVGDAAHVVHPLAGQGLNLGLADVSEWLRVLAAREAFRDPGDLVLLRRYERARAEPLALMRWTTDGLSRLFAADDPWVRRLRNTGLAAVERIAPLKRALVRRALG